MNTSTHDIHPAPISVKLLLAEFVLGLLRRPELSDKAFRVAVAIASHANQDGQASPSATRLMSMTGVAKADTIYAITDRLHRAGVLTKTRRPPRPNTYQLPQRVVDAVIASYRAMKNTPTERGYDTPPEGGCNTPTQRGVTHLHTPSEGDMKIYNNNLIDGTNLLTTWPRDGLSRLNGSGHELVNQLAEVINPQAPNLSLAEEALRAIPPEAPPSVVRRAVLEFVEDCRAKKIQGQFSARKLLNYVDKAMEFAARRQARLEAEAKRAAEEPDWRERQERERHERWMNGARPWR